MQGKIINTIVILLSTCENGLFDVSFKSVGGVETEILMSPKWTFYDFFFVYQYLCFYTPCRCETYTKVSPFRVL